MTMPDLHRLPRDGALADAEHPLVARPVRRDTTMGFDLGTALAQELECIRVAVERLVAIEEERIALETMVNDALMPKPVDMANVDWFVVDGIYWVRTSCGDRRATVAEAAAIQAQVKSPRPR